MRQIEFNRTGIPSEVVTCVPSDDPVIAEPDDVLIRIEAFPINPADLLTLQGFYPRSRPDARTLGVEALGHIEAVGPSVTGLARGDRVIPLSVDNWVERKVLKAHQLVRVSATLDPLRLAGLKVNPATAQLLLNTFVELQAGDWLVQNTANSAVGRAAIYIAKRRGIKTLNVVRRADAIAELKAIGADVVLVDGDDLPQRASEALDGAPVRLALDAVAGSATNHLAGCLAEKGALVIYGAMSGQAATLSPGLVAFKDISIRGFWLTRYLATADRAAVEHLYSDLERLLADGMQTGRVDCIFAAEDIAAAVKRAGETRGGDKVFVRFD